jgi:hypothetical protein
MKSYNYEMVVNLETIYFLLQRLFWDCACKKKWT